MLSVVLSPIFLAAFTFAKPIYIRQTLASNSPVAPNENLTWIGDSSLPKVLWVTSTGCWLYNTGDGTILSGSSYSHTDNINYGSGPGLTPETLIGNVTDVLKVAQIAVIFAAGGGAGSANANSDRFLNIGRDATSRMCGPDSDITGAVMIHGTNSLAETSFGVDLTFNCSKPFITTGAMRPNTAYSADGPFNFYDAVRAAVHPESRDRGGMLAFDDHLISAFYGTKTNGNTVGTFKAHDQGYIAQFLGGQPYFFFDPSLPKARHHFNPFSISLPMPPVVVLYGHQGFDANLLYAAADNGAKGIVIMGVGPGALSDNATIAANDLYEKRGVITVASLRTFYGAVVPKPTVQTIISSGFLHGEQSRIQLQLCLASGYNINQTRAVFESEIRAAVYTDATSFYSGTTLELPF